MPAKSLFRGPDARHFNVVHRSQRDPLIHDPEAGDRILSEVVRQNKGKSKAELEDELDVLNNDNDGQRDNLGEASLYNVYFDDTDYDYMQHLRPTGGSTEAIFIAAPSSRQQRTDPIQPKEFSFKDDVELKLPNEVLPVLNDATLSYKQHLEFAIPSHSLGRGLLPNIDTGLREVLEALDDEEYVEEAATDTFFETIIVDGERKDDETLEWQDTASASVWENSVGVVKQQSVDKRHQIKGSDDEWESEDGDTIGDLKPKFTRQPWESGKSSGSAFSMSSSAMFRNEGLSTLDERFDQIEKEYLSSDEESDTSNEEKRQERSDFEDTLDTFLSRYEISGGKFKVALEGSTALEKLDVVRSELAKVDGLNREMTPEEEKEVLKLYILAAAERQSKTREKQVDTLVAVDRYEDRWDCESILSTYSNVEHHPRVIGMRKGLQRNLGQVATISVDHKTGFPLVDGISARPSKPSTAPSKLRDSVTELKQETVKRDRHEGKEDKKLRKSQVKEERAGRRMEKKANKDAFAIERRKQVRATEKMLLRRAADSAGPEARAGVTGLS